ncbi:MAG: hypothetical protein GY749_06410 [Desulfobacteraceae bacterium]|nr:hypothetical protein [Desulfobacteraceae bacterium]
MALHMLELPKFEEKIKKSGKLRDRLSQWLHFFNHAYEEGDETMRTHYENPAIHKAFGVLEALSADEETRRLAQIREDALMSEQYELDAAKRKGKKERDHEIALKMLDDGMKPEMIKKYTDLSADEITALKKKKKRSK